MKEQDIYNLLEDKMLSYPDYANVPVEPNNEELMPIPDSDNLTARQIGEDMRPYTGEQIFVRHSVLERLGQAALYLTELQPGLQLEVVYGYRALEIQTKLFEHFEAQLQDQYNLNPETKLTRGGTRRGSAQVFFCLTKNTWGGPRDRTQRAVEFRDSGQYSGEELLAAVHRLVAVPAVAGHPAGAAVDIHIAQADKALEFGTKAHDFVPNSYTFSPFISREAWFNRQLLRQAMMGAGFAPFDGEWWHFSYGDKEWARYYGKEAAVYEQVNFRN